MTQRQSPTWAIQISLRAVESWHSKLRILAKVHINGAKNKFRATVIWMFNLVNVDFYLICRVAKLNKNLIQKQNVAGTYIMWSKNTSAVAKTFSKADPLRCRVDRFDSKVPISKCFPCWSVWAVWVSLKIDLEKPISYMNVNHLDSNSMMQRGMIQSNIEHPKIFQVVMITCWGFLVFTHPSLKGWYLHSANTKMEQTSTSTKHPLNFAAFKSSKTLFAKWGPLYSQIELIEFETWSLPMIPQNAYRLEPESSLNPWQTNDFAFPEDVYRTNLICNSRVPWYFAPSLRLWVPPTWCSSIKLWQKHLAKSLRLRGKSSCGSLWFRTLNMKILHHQWIVYVKQHVLRLDIPKLQSFIQQNT